MQQQTAETTPPHAPAPEGPSPTGTATPHATADEKGLAAVAYILTWITGLIIFLVAKKEQRYARWNAIQAIGLGIAFFVVGIALSVLQAAFIFTAAAVAMIIGLLLILFWIGAVVVIVLCAVKAYQGNPIRVPVLVDFADKNA